MALVVAARMPYNLMLCHDINCAYFTVFLLLLRSLIYVVFWIFQQGTGSIGLEVRAWKKGVMNASYVVTISCFLFI